jgi:hypothetical protein
MVNETALRSNRANMKSDATTTKTNNREAILAGGSARDVVAPVAAVSVVLARNFFTVAALRRYGSR